MLITWGACAVQVGGEVQLKAGYTVRPFQTVHVIPSQGYLVFQQRKKLRAEFQGAGRDAIIAAKKSGVDVNTTWEVCLRPLLGRPPFTLVCAGREACVACLQRVRG